MGVGSSQPNFCTLKNRLYFQIRKADFSILTPNVFYTAITHQILIREEPFRV
ncbi:hypothetical protein J2Z37_000578 [Ammoniphilus resinae]|uniref:Uncharacterized protein n=1 Tax=Ammoniphilus resinae TaxID=861532 RepID=A0ABS4GK18_9BACL|nr:hypothetical protein [Ammoniphilus resinae]